MEQVGGKKCIPEYKQVEL